MTTTKARREQLVRDAIMQCAGMDVPFDRADVLVRVPYPAESWARLKMFDAPLNGLVKAGVLVEVVSPTSGKLWVSARGLERSGGKVPHLHGWGDEPSGGQVKRLEANGSNGSKGYSTRLPESTKVISCPGEPISGNPFDPFDPFCVSTAASFKSPSNRSEAHSRAKSSPTGYEDFNGIEN